METTRYIRSDGLDLGQVLLEREYFLSNYTSIANQYITPELWVWGGGLDGRLGNNATISAISTPITTFAGGANWKQVCPSERASAAIKMDGTLWTWGWNGYNQLGTNDNISRSTPVTTFLGGTNWKQIDGGNECFAAVKTDGTLWVWGQNFGGNLGINVLGGQRSTPVTTFAGGNNWKQVACGYRFTAAIKTDGTLWIWGDNSRNDIGKLGINSANGSLIVCTPVTTFAGGNNWKQVACGEDHAAAIKTDGTLWTWGGNSNYQVGNGPALADRYAPVTTYVGGNDWKQVSCGSNHTAAIKTDGTLWVWGDNFYGQLGLGGSLDRCIPTSLSGNNWRRVSCGGNTTAAIKTDGTLWVWGRGTSGELGQLVNGNRATPITTFLGGNNWKQVDCGIITLMAIRSYDEY